MGKSVYRYIKSIYRSEYGLTVYKWILINVCIVIIIFFLLYFVEMEVERYLLFYRITISIYIPIEFIDDLYLLMDDLNQYVKDIYKSCIDYLNYCKDLIDKNKRNDK